ncbi:hypothetical protein BDF14DRAFT_1764951 [Spinellus fusiger]|nr:hypothetical protein BDF14DRAFT_1764951 [Spinellus fusiger]
MSVPEGLVEVAASVATTAPETVLSPAINTETGLEGLLDRHRVEQRNLQTTIAALHKSVPKSDKRKKRAVASRIVELEYALRTQQEKELAQLKALESGEESVSTEEADDGISLERLSMLTVDKPIAPLSSPALPSPVKRKVNKHDLKKLRREADIERRQTEAEKEAQHQVDKGATETEAVKRLLVPMHLELKQITADGHCLYNAIADQLERVYHEKSTYKELRNKAASYIRDHPDEFIPFLYNDNGDMYTTEDLEQYCTAIEETACWGGQLEIVALCKANQVPIHVIQVESPLIKVGEEEFTGKSPLMIV